jgi:hypothetical protein
MDIKKLDVPALLQQLAEMREKMPKPEGPRSRSRLPGSSATRTKLPRPGNAMADFETQGLIETLESMAEEIRTVIEEKQADTSRARAGRGCSASPVRRCSRSPSVWTRWTKHANALRMED